MKRSELTARSPEEVKSRVKQNNDALGFGKKVLIRYLPYEDAKEYLKDGVTKEDWQDHDLGSPEEDARGYLDFAWKKANGERGISANRSVEKFEAWLWLAEMDEALREFKRAPFPQYGKPKLEVVDKYLTEEE